MSRAFQLVIIGGGATGALVLLKAVLHSAQLKNPMQITIVEPSEYLGLGRAYSTLSGSHLLNVPTKKMSIFRDTPEDFDRWVLSRQPKAQESDAWPFVPRIWFGDYLKEKIGGIPKSSYTHLRKSATDVSKTIGENDDMFKVSLDDGSFIAADGVVVATGYQEAISPRVLRGQESDRFKQWVLQPYNSNELKKIRPQDSVLIVGTGLTAIDIFRQLRGTAGFEQSEIHFLSRRGLFPISHDLSPQAPPQTPLDLVGVPPLESFRKVRLAQERQSLSWVAIADHVRVQVQKIWKSWEAPARQQFGRHLKPYWENIRHRIPPAVALELDRYLKANPDRLHAGRIQSTKVEGDHLLVSYRERHSLETKEFKFNWVVLANGAELSDALLVGGALAADSLLWRVGPASKETFWEITSIPDIVPQLDQVIGEIVEKARSYS